MLAQNFKTAADLGLKDVELEALIKVLGMLERGELSRKGAQVINMGWWFGQNECGTVGCIAGWAHHISGGKAFPFLDDTGIAPDHLTNLFIPAQDSDLDVANKRMQKIAPDHVARALRAFLTTGEADWAEALA